MFNNIEHYRNIEQKGSTNCTAYFFIFNKNIYLKIMLIKKKYYNMLLFASLFDENIHGDDMVEISNDFAIAKYNELVGAVSNLNGRVLDDIVELYDYDGDGKVSFIDLYIFNAIIQGDITSDNDSLKNGLKYNNKSLDLDNSGSINITDSGIFNTNVTAPIIQKVLLTDIFVPKVIFGGTLLNIQQLFTHALSFRSTTNGKYDAWPSDILSQLRNYYDNEPSFTIVSWPEEYV